MQGWSPGQLWDWPPLVSGAEHRGQGAGQVEMTFSHHKHLQRPRKGHSCPCLPGTDPLRGVWSPVLGSSGGAQLPSVQWGMGQGESDTGALRLPGHPVDAGGSCQHTLSSRCSPQDTCAAALGRAGSQPALTGDLRDTAGLCTWWCEVQPAGHWTGATLPCARRTGREWPRGPQEPSQGPRPTDLPRHCPGVH